MLDHDSIMAALHRVVDPCSIATGVPISLVDMGMIQKIVDDDGRVQIELRLTSPICWQAANIIAKVEDVVGQVPGIHSVTCKLDAGAEWMPDMMAPEARARLRRTWPLPGVQQAAGVIA